jgi:hypothetical protein
MNLLRIRMEEDVAVIATQEATKVATEVAKLTT